MVIDGRTGWYVLLLAWMLGSGSVPPISSSSACGERQVFSSGRIVSLNS